MGKKWWRLAKTSARHMARRQQRARVNAQRHHHRERAHPMNQHRMLRMRCLEISVLGSLREDATKICTRAGCTNLPTTPHCKTYARRVVKFADVEHVFTLS